MTVQFLESFGAHNTDLVVNTARGMEVVPLGLQIAQGTWPERSRFRSSRPTSDPERSWRQSYCDYWLIPLKRLYDLISLPYCPWITDFACSALLIGIASRKIIQICKTNSSQQVRQFWASSRFQNFLNPDVIHCNRAQPLSSSFWKIENLLLDSLALQDLPPIVSLTCGRTVSWNLRGLLYH